MPEIHAPEPIWEGFIGPDGGVRLWARHFRPAEPSGPALVVPNAVYLEADFRHLARSREVVFYDLRGRGRSDAVEDPSKLGIAFDGTDVEAVRRHFELDTISLLGHSYLGYVVARYALDHPGRVARLVQIGPVAPASEIAARTPAPGEDPGGLDMEAWGAFVEDFRAGRAQEDPEGMTDRYWEIFLPYMFGDAAKARLYDPPPADLPNEQVHRMLATVRTVMGTFGDYDVRGPIGELDLPVLIVHGTADRQAPYESARAWLGAFGNARLLTVEGAAHLPWVEAPDQVMPAIATFLDGGWPDDASSG